MNVLNIELLITKYKEDLNKIEIKLKKLEEEYLSSVELEVGLNYYKETQKEDKINTYIKRYYSDENEIPLEEAEYIFLKKKRFDIEKKLFKLNFNLEKEELLLPRNWIPQFVDLLNYWKHLNKEYLINNYPNMHINNLKDLNKKLNQEWEYKYKQLINLICNKIGIITNTYMLEFDGKKLKGEIEGKIGKFKIETLWENNFNNKYPFNFKIILKKF